MKITCKQHSSYYLYWSCLIFLFLTTFTTGSRFPQPYDESTWLDDALLQEQSLSSASSTGGKRGGSESSSNSNNGLASSSLWFGPRLGRRRRSPPDDQQQDGMGLDYVLDSDEGTSYIKAESLLGRDSPWTLIAVKELSSSKRQTLPLTPRLGRELFEGEILVRSSPPFSPRLGRANGLPFSPRLGRQQNRHSTQH